MKKLIMAGFHLEDFQKLIEHLIATNYNPEETKRLSDLLEAICKR